MKRLKIASVLLVLNGASQVSAADYGMDDKAINVVGKAVIKQMVKEVSKKAVPAVDLLWPSSIGYDPAYEDPSSKEYKARMHSLSRD